MTSEVFGRYQPLTRRLVRLLAWIAAALAVIFLAGLLVIRLWIWPSLAEWEQQARADITTALGKNGLTFAAGEVSADWETWWRPRLVVDGLSISDPEGHRVLAIREIRATMGPRSMTMLWHWQPIFSEIELEDVTVFAQRTSSGVLQIAGFSVSEGKADGAGFDWLLRQGRVRIDGGEILWRDAQRDKATRLKDLTFAMTNLGISHAWALRATPPSSLGEGFVLQANFRHSLFDAPSNLAAWAGEAFVQFDRVDLAALFEFVHLPADAPLTVKAGQGALRAWFTLDRSSLEDLTADLDLTDASLRWGKTREALTLQRLTGRVETAISSTRQVVRLKDLQLQSKQLETPLSIPNAQLVVRQSSNGEDSETDLSAAVIDLASAMWLAEHLPLPSDWRRQLMALSPKGRLNNLVLKWRETPALTTGFELDTSFVGLALAEGVTRPGFTSLSGRVKAKEDGGELTLSGESGTLVFPKVFEDPRLSFDRLDGQFYWTSKNVLAADMAVTRPEISVQIKKLSISNPDLAVEVSGSGRWPGEGPGEVDLTGKVLRADIRRVHRYVPLSASADTRQWLKESLLSASSATATFALTGPLAAFPFRDPSQGRFLVTAETNGASMRPAAGWPTITGIHATVEFDRQAFRLTANKAKMGEMSLGETKATIADLESKRPILEVNGPLTGDLQRLVDLVNRSPVQGMLGGLTTETKGRGDARLDLGLRIDLDNTDRSTVSGRLTLSKGTVRLTPELPEVAVTTGEFQFTQEGLQKAALQGQALGGAMRLNSRPSSTPGQTILAIDGQASAAGLGVWLDQVTGISLKDSISGGTSYQLAVESLRGVTQARLRTNLVGLGLDAFGPLKKRARDDWALRVDLIQTAPQAGGQRQQTWTIASNQDKLNARVQRTPINARESMIDINARDIAGQLRWRPGESKARDGKSLKGHGLLSAKLSRLWLDKPEQDEPSSIESQTTAIAQDWPNLELVIDDFRVGERQWGKLELSASPSTATRSWEVQRFSLVNPDASLTGQGQWAMLPSVKGQRRSRTALDVELQLNNGGALLSRSGYPNVVRDTAGKITGKLNWPGSPLEFSGSVLNGALALDLRSGRFLKAEPGLARLIGVLNLQSLPSRIKLDFRDVFSEGFTYDQIRGDLTFANGLASTQNLRIIGVQASVLLEGSADINRETQDLRVLVLPEVNAGLASLGYAALVNPAVGLGAFIAQFILRNPLRELLSYEYRVTGTWSDPVVQSVKREMRSDIPEMKSSDK